MRAAVFRGAGTPLSVEDIDDPVAADGEVVIKVKAVGVCGSDLHATEDGAFLQQTGTVLGHEFAGEVTSSRDPKIAVGTRATVVPIELCDECRPSGRCKDGLEAICPNSNFTGLAFERPGAYAEYVRVLGAKVVPLPASVDFEEGALVEPFAVGLHAVDMAEIAIGARVLIIGAGPIGLAVSTFANLAGAASVVVSDFAEARREIAREFGATDTLNPAVLKDINTEFENLAGGAPDIIFDCVGVPGTLQSAIDAAKPRGTVIVVGVCMKTDSILPLTAALKELKIQFVMAYQQSDFARVLNLIAGGRLDARKMITNRTTLEDLPEEFEKIRKPVRQIKLMISPGD